MKKINFSSITFRLVFGGCVLVLLPLLIVGAVSIYESTNALSDVSEKNAQDLLNRAEELNTIVGKFKV